MHAPCEEKRKSFAVTVLNRSLGTRKPVSQELDLLRTLLDGFRIARLFGALLRPETGLIRRPVVPPVLPCIFERNLSIDETFNMPTEGAAWASNELANNVIKLPKVKRMPFTLLAQLEQITWYSEIALGPS